MFATRFPPTLAVVITSLVASSAATGETILGPYPGGFGSSVAIEGEWLAVGAPGDSKVYLFRNEAGAWNLKQIAAAIAPQAGDEFGASLAMKNGWLFVGAPARDETAGPDAGAVYTFKLNNGFWGTNVKLTAGDPQANAAFGTAVSATATDILIGAPGAGGGSGAAYVIHLSLGTWSQQAKLTAPNPAIGDTLGNAVGIDGETAVVGAAGTNGKIGAAYAFERSGSSWSLKANLLPPALGPGFDNIGTAVAIENDVIAVGAPSVNGWRQWTNIYRRISSNWTYEDTVEGFVTAGNTDSGGCGLLNLLAEWGGPYANCPFAPFHDEDNSCHVDFRDVGLHMAMYCCLGNVSGAGRALAISSERLIVGAPDAQSYGCNRMGMVHAFHAVGSDWRELNVFAPAEPQSGIQFGASVAASGQTVVSGAPGGGVAVIHEVDEPRTPLVTHSLKPVPNALIANAKTFDLVATISSPALGTNHWAGTTVVAQTNGQFYNDPIGGNSQPNPAFFSVFPKLEFDTFTTQPEGWPNVPSQGAFTGLAGTTTFGTTITSVAWFDIPPNGGPGTYVLARFTVIGGTALQVTGATFDYQVGLESKFDLLVKLTSCKWDLNGDGKVCQEDLGQLLAFYGTLYNQSDLGQLLAEYDGGCGEPC